MPLTFHWNNEVIGLAANKPYLIFFAEDDETYQYMTFVDMDSEKHEWAVPTNIKAGKYTVLFEPGNEDNAGLGQIELSIDECENMQ